MSRSRYQAHGAAGGASESGTESTTNTKRQLALPGRYQKKTLKAATSWIVARDEEVKFKVRTDGRKGPKWALKKVLNTRSMLDIMYPGPTFMYTYYLCSVLALAVFMSVRPTQSPFSNPFLPERYMVDAFSPVGRHYGQYWR